MAERFAYYGVSSNLITFLTDKLGQSTAAAAANVNAWTGVACLLPILGGFVADYLLGKYYAVLASSFLYILVSINLSTLLDHFFKHCFWWERISGQNACF